MGKSEGPYALSNMSRFDDLETSVTLDVPMRILRDAGTEIFKTHKTGTNKTTNRA